MKKSIMLVAFLVIALSASSAWANANLVVNPGFESGSLVPGWVGGNSVESCFTFGISCNSGNFYLAFGAVGGVATTSQDIPTIVGNTYTFSAWEASDGALPNEFQMSWGGNIILDLVNQSAHGYELFSFQETATAAVTTIGLGGRNDPAFDGVDDVSVVSPEPASLSLIGNGTGFLTVGVYFLRRRKANVAE